MKNKKIFLWAFLFILLAQIGLGVSQVCKYLDILQNGKIVKVSYVSIGNIDNYEYKPPGTSPCKCKNPLHGPAAEPRRCGFPEQIIFQTANIQ